MKSDTTMAGSTQGSPSEEISITQDSALLELPAELRNRTYRYAMTSDEAVEVEGEAIISSTKLLQVCHQIREEATSIFYAENAFTVTCVDFNIAPILCWFFAIRQKNVSTISKIHIKAAFSQKSSSALADMRTYIRAGDRDSSWTAVGQLCEGLFTEIWVSAAILRKLGVNITVEIPIADMPIPEVHMKPFADQLVSMFDREMAKPVEELELGEEEVVRVAVAAVDSVWIEPENPSWKAYLAAQGKE